MGDPTRAAVDETTLKEAMRRFIDLNVNEEFLNRYGAHAIAITRRKRGPSAARTPDLSLTFYVRPGHKPSTHGVVPDGVTEILPVIPFADPVTGRTIDIPTDVVEERVAAEQKGGKASGTRAKPVAGGVACIAEPRTGLDPVNGTAGGWVWDSEDDTFVILSNMHVLGEEEKRPIYHPTYASRKVLGVMKRGAWTVKPQTKTLVDCALVKVDQPERAIFSVREIGGAVMATGDPTEELLVEKVGDGTNKTQGKVVDADWHGFVENPMTGTTRMFFDCVKIEPDEDPKWSAMGDSGALVFSREKVSGPRGMSRRVVVGLHVGGDPVANKWGVACRITNVFKALNLSTIPQGLINVLADQALGGALPAGATEDEIAERSQRREAMIHLMMEFADRCHDAPGGNPIMNTLDAHHEVLVAILAQQSGARNAVADLLKRLFTGKAQVDEVEALKLDKYLMASARKATDVLLKSSKGPVKKSLQTLRALLPRAGQMTMGEFLKGGS